jgi:hypothetical protein
VSIASAVRVVVREKKRAQGMAWRRLHRAETLLMLASGQLRPLERAPRKKRAPRKPQETKDTQTK